MHGLVVEEVMVLWNMTRSNVYVTAHRHKWRRWRDDHGRIMYAAADVAKTMSREDAA